MMVTRPTCEKCGNPLFENEDGELLHGGPSSSPDKISVVIETRDEEAETEEDEEARKAEARKAEEAEEAEEKRGERG